MNDQELVPTALLGETDVERYYRWHAPVYDLTRWTFLFGRDDILHQLVGDVSAKRVLEVGCGTGRNLVELARLFPAARLTGLDLSSAMLERAEQRTAQFASRVNLLQGRYDGPVYSAPTFDLVLFSYSLTMFNPGFDLAIDSAARDLVHGGRIAVVDFHDSPSTLFERWVAVNHVCAKGQLRPLLQERFMPLHDEVRPAYGGVWRYLMFLGQKR